MSTQLRLVDAPARARRPTGTKHARASARRGRRLARWDVDWHLDAATRQAGRAGVAAARDALTRADDDLLEAS